MRVLAAALVVAAHAFDFNVTQKSYDYPEVLRLTTRFYGAQRCGPDSDNWLLASNPVGRDCHHQDGRELGESVDLTGGWHDAGDHIKFTLTHGFTIMALLKGYEVFQPSYRDLDSPDYSGVPNGIPDILDEVKFATDWLIKAHIAPDVLISRIAGDQDHWTWLTAPAQTRAPPELGGDPRPVYGGGNGEFNSKADIAGTAAAALAQMSRLYRNFSETYADTCLRHAIEIYEIAKNNRGATPQPGLSFYGKSTWLDSLTCGAVELFRATNQQPYLTEALQWDNGSPHYWVVDWSNHWDYCRHSLATVGHLNAGWRTDANSYPTKVEDVEFTRGLAWFYDWATLRYAMNAAFSAALFWDVTGRNNEILRTFAMSQLDYALGTNEYDRSFVVGYGHNPPVRAHHASAFGKDRFPTDNYEPHQYEITGALVGGPTRTPYYDWQGVLVSPRGYEDWTNDYVGNEVTIEYNSGLVGLAAFAVQFGSSAETQSRT